MISRPLRLISVSFTMAAVLLLHASLSPASEQRITLTAGDLRPYFMKALAQYAPWKEGEMEVREVTMYPSTVAVPKGKLEVEAEPPPGGRFLGRVTFLMTLSVDGEPERRIRMAGYVEVHKEVLCTATALRRGHVLSPSDLVTVRRPLSRLRGRPVASLHRVVGMALKRSVSAGQVVTEALLTPPIIVKRGDRVTILAKNPWIEIKAPGEARQNGAKGDVIRVKNLMSKKEITAEVVDASTVTVRF